MPMLLYGNGTISGATSLAGNISVAGYANVSQGLSTVSRGISNASIPVGSIIQVSAASGFSELAISSSSYSSVGTVSITPTSSSSKILILASLVVHRNATGNNGWYWDAWVYRGTTSTRIASLCDAALYQSYADGFRASLSISYLDSPASASSTTYGLCGSRLAGTGSAQFSQGGVSSITVMEIAQ